jgi:hypothetical protein
LLKETPYAPYGAIKPLDYDNMKKTGNHIFVEIVVKIYKFKTNL